VSWCTQDGLLGGPDQFGPDHSTLSASNRYPRWAEGKQMDWPCSSRDRKKILAPPGNVWERPNSAHPSFSPPPTWHKSAKNPGHCLATFGPRIGDLGHRVRALPVDRSGPYAPGQLIWPYVVLWHHSGVSAICLTRSGHSMLAPIGGRSREPSLTTDHLATQKVSWST